MLQMYISVASVAACVNDLSVTPVCRIHGSCNIIMFSVPLACIARDRLLVPTCALMLQVYINVASVAACTNDLMIRHCAAFTNVGRATHACLACESVSIFTLCIDACAPW